MRGRNAKTRARVQHIEQAATHGMQKPGQCGAPFVVQIMRIDEAHTRAESTPPPDDVPEKSVISGNVWSG